MFSNGLSLRASFRLKVALGLMLVGLFDVLFLFHRPGATVGAFAAAWLAAVVVARPGLIRDRRALAMLAAALGFALLMVERPGPLAWLLYGLALTIAVLSARVKAGEPVWRWGQRLVLHGVIAGIGPVIDLPRVLRGRRGTRAGFSFLSLARLLLLPIVGGLVFFLLFAQANPLITDLARSARLPGPTIEGVLRVVCWGPALLVIAATLRPRWRRALIALPSLGAARLPGVSSASVILSLAVFNAVFALQNGLDVAFLWSGAELPGDLTLADYAHRGAYPLIGTALLAGLFVLIALRPGTETGRSPLARGLVVLWIGQNMLLVASCLLRTADYVASFGLTRFRIAAMIWMVLVGLGLALICWRLLAGRDGNWLVDANVKLLLVVLAAVSVVDLGAIAAAWNVRHAREVGGGGVELDLGYLNHLGAPAAVSLVELERTADDPEFRQRVASVRAEVVARMRRDQSRWRGWTWRDARRLARIDAMAAETPLIRATGRRGSDGRLIPPPPPAPEPPAVIVPVAPAPLTSTPGV